MHTHTMKHCVAMKQNEVVMCVELNDIQDKFKKEKKGLYISSNKEGRERDIQTNILVFA